MTDLEKFKFLLEYFVSHLEYLKYYDRGLQALRGRGYAQYILPILSNFKLTGQGHNGDSIQNQVSSWEQYTCGKKTSGKIFINVQVNFNRRTTAANYLCWDGTKINIVAKWSFLKTVITDLIIEDNSTKGRKKISQKSISNLGLFDGKKPNGVLNSFWQTYSQYA